MTRRWVMVGAALLTVAALVLAGAALARPSHQSHSVAIPPDTATPREVTSAYLDALGAHDCSTALALTAGEAERSSARHWCHDLARLDRVRLTVVEGETHGRVAGVQASFDLRWRLFHADGSMPAGRMVWGWRLERPSPTAPWRIVDEGMG